MSESGTKRTKALSRHDVGSRPKANMARRQRMCMAANDRKRTRSPCWLTTLLLLVIAVTLAFAWIFWPFYEAILWATVLAIVFAPLYRRPSHVMGCQHSSLPSPHS